MKTNKNSTSDSLDKDELNCKIAELNAQKDLNNKRIERMQKNNDYLNRTFNWLFLILMISLCYYSGSFFLGILGYLILIVLSF